MAHFALVRGGIVQRVDVLVNDVITDDDGQEQEALGQAFLADLFGTQAEEWIQTSYNGNPIGGKDRGPYAGIGYAWDGEKFIPPAASESTQS